jgi:hypothetical protein
VKHGGEGPSPDQLSRRLPIGRSFAAALSGAGKSLRLSHLS